MFKKAPNTNDTHEVHTSNSTARKASHLLPAFIMVITLLAAMSSLMGFSQSASAFTFINTDQNFMNPGIDTGYYYGNTNSGNSSSSPGIDDSRYFQGGSNANPTYQPSNPSYQPSSQGQYVTPSLDDCRYFKPCTANPTPTPPSTPTPENPYVTPPLDDCRYFKPCDQDSGNGGYVSPPLDDCRYFKPCTNPTPTPQPPYTPQPYPPEQPQPIPPSNCMYGQYPRDIDGHWAEIYVRRLYDLCIVEGYGDSSFRPEQKITRAELTKMGLASGEIAPNSSCYDADCGSPFTDLDMWQGPWVRPAWDRHIVQGYSANRFRPNQAVTRAEAVKIVLASFGYGPLQTNQSFFKDVRGWSVGWIEQAHAIGLIQGIGNGNFDPNRAITRAEAAKIIAKMVEYWNTKIQ